MIKPQTLDDLRKETQRSANRESTTLTPEKQTALTQLVHELDVTRVDLEVKNEALQRVSRQLEMSRDEFYDLYETAPVALVILSGKGVIERINAAAEQLLAAIRRPIVGCGFSMVVHPDDRKRHDSSLKKIARAKKASFFELRLAGEKRDTIHAHIQTAPKQGPDGGFRHWRLALFDVNKAAAKLGSTVRLESEPGTGSTFYLRLLPDERPLSVSKETA